MHLKEHKNHVNKNCQTLFKYLAVAVYFR